MSKGERIFAEAMGEKEFQVQEASWTLLGLQGWLREIQKKYVCVAEANGSLFKRGGTGWEFSSVVVCLRCLHTTLSSIPEKKRST